MTDYVVRITHQVTGEIIEQCRSARIPSIAREGLVRAMQSKRWVYWNGDGYWGRENLVSLVRPCTPDICGYHKKSPKIQGTEGNE